MSCRLTISAKTTIRRLGRNIRGQYSVERRTLYFLRDLRRSLRTPPSMNTSSSIESVVKCRFLRQRSVLFRSIIGNFSSLVCEPISFVASASSGPSPLEQPRSLSNWQSTIADLGTRDYGRTYCEKLVASGVDLWNYPWKGAEFLHIAQTQCGMEDKLAREANRILICDTDVLATGIRHERYMKSRSHKVEAIAASRHYDLYALTDCDIPFVQDGLRDGEAIRRWMTLRFEETLSLRQLPWIKVSGSSVQRFKAAVEWIERILIPNSVKAH